MSQPSNPDRAPDAPPADPQADWRGSGLSIDQTGRAALRQAAEARTVTGYLRIWPQAVFSSGKPFLIATQDIVPLFDTLPPHEQIVICDPHED